ncbi:TIGR03668 family PPOX class F420-dependent oxidoreductase [soil metagenome]
MPSGSCDELKELPDRARAIAASARRAALSTSDRLGRPHTVPVGFALLRGEVVTAVDQKPKRGGKELARVANLRADPRVTMMMDRWDEDWRQLGWVMIRGIARLEPPGTATAELVERYPQYRDDPPRGEVIVVRPERLLWWTWK